jgi:hypothetical protein
MSSRAGALIELVSKGKKDVFFSANPQVSFFNSVYMRSVPFTKEIYITQPINAPNWGRWVDFNIEHRGDMARHFYIHLTLPTWLPPYAAAVNPTGIVTDASGVTFGYTNSVAYQIIDKVQIFQDQVLIQEFYGEYLTWRGRQTSEVAKVTLMNQQSGSHLETPLAIGRSATQEMLRVPMPLLGATDLFDPGIPMAALRNQRWRIRIYLRKLQEVVVASDGRLSPQPWDGKPLRIQATKDGKVDTSYVTLPLTAVQPLQLSMESTQVYLPRDALLWLKSQTLRFLYKNIQYDEYVIEDNSFVAASPPYSANVQMPFTIDLIGSVSRLMVAFRSAACTEAGQRSVFTAYNGAEFIQSLRINISNIDRVKQWPPAVFREVTSYWKSIRLALDYVYSNPQNIYSITFGGFDTAQPCGTLQFTRAVLPILYAILAPIPMDPRNKSRKTSLIAYAESWNMFEISGGKGQMMFEDT